MFRPVPLVENVLGPAESVRVRFRVESCSWAEVVQCMVSLIWTNVVILYSLSIPIPSPSHRGSCFEAFHFEFLFSHPIERVTSGQASTENKHVILRL